MDEQLRTLFEEYQGTLISTKTTAAYMELEDLVWRSIGAKIQERSEQAGMIVRDLNKSGRF